MQQQWPSKTFRITTAVIFTPEGVTTSLGCFLFLQAWKQNTGNGLHFWTDYIQHRLQLAVGNSDCDFFTKRPVLGKLQITVSQCFTNLVSTSCISYSNHEPVLYNHNRLNTSSTVATSPISTFRYYQSSNITYSLLVTNLADSPSRFSTCHYILHAKDAISKYKSLF